MFGGSPNGSGDNTLSCHWPNVFGCLPQEQVHCLRYLRHIPRVVPHGLALQRYEAGVGDLSCHQLAELITEQIVVDALEYQRGRLDLRQKGGDVHGVDVFEDAGHGLAAGGLTEESAPAEVGGGALVADGVGEQLCCGLPVAAGKAGESVDLVAADDVGAAGEGGNEDEPEVELRVAGHEVDGAGPREGLSP